MFEKITRMAEKVASQVGETRRGFLGSLGGTALGVVGVLAGLLALPSTAFCDTDCGNGRRCPTGKGCCFTRRGEFDGCCPNAQPHTCRSISTCYQYLTDAQRACGNDPVYVCGGRAGASDAKS